MALLPKNEPRKVVEQLTQKLFIYGEPYSGKTTFASKFPNPVILSTDGNYKFIDTPAVVVNAPQDWLKIYEEIASGDHEFETIIIDIVDHVYETIREDILTENKVMDEQDLGGYGKGYNMVRKPFMALMRRFSLLPYNIIFIGHSATEIKVDRLKRETSVTKSKLPDKLSTFLQGAVDYTFYMNVEQVEEVSEDGEVVTYKKHFLHLNAVDENQTGGSRLHFKKDKIEADYDEFSALVLDSIKNPIKTIIVPNKKVEVKPEKKPLGLGKAKETKEAKTDAKEVDTPEVATDTTTEKKPLPKLAPRK